MWLDKLKEMKTNCGMTTKDISEKSGIPEPTLEKLFAGATKDPKLKTMQQLVHFFGYTLDDLDDEPSLQKKIDNKDNLTPDVMAYIKKYRSLDDYGKEAVNAILDIEHRRCAEVQNEPAERMVQKLVYINPAATGMPLYAESDFEWMSFPENEVPSGADFGIRISGRSMEPTVADGAIVWVHKTVDLESGTVGVFMLNDSAVCKRYFKNGDGTFRLESDNPKFDPAPVTEFDHVVPVGKVVGTA